MFEIDYPVCRRCERKLLSLDRRDGLCSFNSLPYPQRIWEPHKSCYMIFIRWVESREDIVEIIGAEYESGGKPSRRLDPHFVRRTGQTLEAVQELRSDMLESYHVAIDQWFVLGCPDIVPPQTAVAGAP